MQALGLVGPPRQVRIEAATAATPAEPRARAAAVAVSLDKFVQTIGASARVMENVIVVKKNADEDVDRAAGLLPRPGCRTTVQVDQRGHTRAGWAHVSDWCVRGL